jgi:uncharacterized membrane protein
MPGLSIDTRLRGALKHLRSAVLPARQSPDRPLRYLLAIAGLLLGAAAIFAIWTFLPKGTPVPNTQVTAAETTAAPQANSADLSAESQQGSLRVCNETGNKVSVAFGYRAEKGWQSEGWWIADPEKCVTVYHGDLGQRRYYYLFAADDIGGGVWDGTNYMCTRDETFTIFGVEDCLARGYERTGFFEVDTQNKSSWTLQLTDGEVVSNEGDATDDETAPDDTFAPGEDGDDTAVPQDGGDGGGEDSGDDNSASDDGGSDLE